MAVLFQLRLLYEQTVVTWRHGEQVVGFALAHAYPGFFLAGVGTTVSLLLWLPVPAFELLRRHRWPQREEWVYFLLPPLLLALVAVPYGTCASLGGVTLK